MLYTLLAAVEDGPDHFRVVKHNFTTRVAAVTAAIAYVRNPETTPFMVEVDDEDGRPVFMWDPNGDYLVEHDYTDAQWQIAA